MKHKVNNCILDFQILFTDLQPQVADLTDEIEDQSINLPDEPRKTAANHTAFCIMLCCNAARYEPIQKDQRFREGCQ